MADKNPLFVRIPFKLIDDYREGRITLPMLTVMNLLHRWAKWETGIVEWTSASALTLACGGEWHENTIKAALRRLEKKGYITRNFTPHSKKWYPIILHDYLGIKKILIKDENGNTEKDEFGRVRTVQKVVLINTTEETSCDDSEIGECPEDVPDGVPEDVPDGVPETVPNTINTHIHESSDRNDTLAITAGKNREKSESASESGSKTGSKSKPDLESEFVSDIELNRLIEKAIAEGNKLIEERYQCQV